MLLLLILAPTVNFDQSTYSIDEDKGSVQLLLELSNPSTTDITIRVFSSDGSATGKDLYSLTATYVNAITICTCFICL